MNTNRITTLSWYDLISKKMIGKDILIEYEAPKAHYFGPSTVFSVRKVKIIGSDYVENEHILLVEYADDIYIIMKDGIHYDWEAYQYLEDE